MAKTNTYSYTDKLTFRLYKVSFVLLITFPNKERIALCLKGQQYRFFT